MAAAFINNYATTTTSALTSSGTSVVVTNTLPVLTGDSYYLLTLFYVDNGIETNKEIVKVTAVNGNTLTIVRGQENTNSYEWPVGSRVELRVTAAPLNDFIAQGAKADAALPSELYNAADVLAKVKTVDGSGSGLDADMLDGKHASDFATAAQCAKVDKLIPIPLPTKVSATQINVNGTTLTVSSPIAGTDYYFSLSAITTTIQPDTIGGFHYGLTPSGETPTGNKTASDITAIAGINQYSIWTKWFRPSCDPRGMVHINGRWYDIYLMDSAYGIRKYSAPTAKIGFNIAGGTTVFGRQIPLIPIEFGGTGTSNYGKFTWFQANEIAKAAGKTLISYNDFPTIAYGVQEQVDASSQDGGNGLITHFANLNSKWGVEQATGTQWIFGSDVQGSGGEVWEGGLTDNRGSIYAYIYQPTAVLFGASRDAGALSGSRASYWPNSVWNTHWTVGSRFSCDHMSLA